MISIRTNAQKKLRAKFRRLMLASLNEKMIRQISPTSGMLKRIV